MTRLDSFAAEYTTTEFDRSVNTTTANDPELLSSEMDNDRLVWDRIINCQLIDWATRPEEFDDEIDPPSDDSISTGCEVVRYLRNNKMPAPSRVVPTGDGGIAFEIVEGNNSTTIEIDEYGEIEIMEFHHSRLVNRTTI